MLPGMRSMTGFGRASAKSGELEVRCELKSVNQRGLEVRLRADREFLPFEQEVVSAVRAAFERGRFEVGLALEERSGRVSLRFDAPLASAVVKELLAFARNDGQVTPHVTAGDLLRRPELFAVEDLASARAEDLLALTREALAGAIEDLREARAVEGRGLAAELEARLVATEGHVAAIASRTSDAPARLKEKLESRLKEVDTTPIPPERLAQEVAILAERADVQEELARLSLHIAHFRELAAQEGAVGRKLDFLCQELMREANTVGSKCADAETAHHVVDLKAEIERLREQVQNVE